MSILSWIEDKKRLKVLNAPKHANASTDSSKGLWTRCDKCGVILYIKHLKENQRVCFGCSYHLQMMSQERIENLLDKVPATSSLLPNKSKKVVSFATPEGYTRTDEKSSAYKPLSRVSAKKKKKSKTDLSEVLQVALPPKATRTSSRENMVSTWRPLDETVSPCNPLKFYDQKAYTDRLQDAQERTGLQDAIQTGTGMIDGIPVALAVMDFSFMGGSMGSVVGEKITRLIEYATQEGLTLLIVSASGGARMQEGVFSLMQMAKISSALQIYQSCARLLYISILTSPTTGGVTASFAMLGDIIFAEPKALIAFAGRRVIEQTLREDLPDDFQTSEYMLHHGLVDLIVPRRFLRQALSESIRLYQNAPFKKRGQIPFGVQNPITFLTEEKIRRQWGRLTKPGQKAFTYKSFSCKQAFAERKLEAKLLQRKPLVSKTKICKEQLFTTNPQGLREPLQVQSEALQEDLYRSQDSPLYAPRHSSVKEQDTLKEMSYREILTSFDIMLHLFLSGNTKKQNESLCKNYKNETFCKGLPCAPMSMPVRRYTVGQLAYKSSCFNLNSTKKISSSVLSKKSKKIREFRGPFGRLSLSFNNGQSKPSLLRSFRSFAENRHMAYKSSYVQGGAYKYKASLMLLQQSCPPLYKTKFCTGLVAFATRKLEAKLLPKPPDHLRCNPSGQSNKSTICKGNWCANKASLITSGATLRGTGGDHTKRSFVRTCNAYALKKQELDSTFSNRSAIGFTRTAFFQERAASFLQDSYQSNNFESLLRKKRNFVTSENGKAQKLWCFPMFCMQFWCQQRAKIDRYTKQSFASTSLRDTFYLLQKSKYKPPFNGGDSVPYKYIQSSGRSFASNFRVAKADKSSYNNSGATHTNLGSKATRPFGQRFVKGSPPNKSAICTPRGVAPEVIKVQTFDLSEGDHNGHKVDVQCKNIDREKSFILPAKVEKKKPREKAFRLKGWEGSKESLFPSYRVHSFYENNSKKSGENGALCKENTVFTAQEKDINFLNRAIELAATESVEWRAFYLYQQLSENTGFLEDFLQQDLNFRARAGNVLFYKSICQSRKVINE